MFRSWRSIKYHKNKISDGQTASLKGYSGWSSAITLLGLPGANKVKNTGFNVIAIKL